MLYKLEVGKRSEFRKKFLLKLSNLQKLEKRVVFDILLHGSELIRSSKLLENSEANHQWIHCFVLWSYDKI